MRTITINEDVKLPGTNIVLEKGDRIRVIDYQILLVGQGRLQNGLCNRRAWLSCFNYLEDFVVQEEEKLLIFL